jgi:DNA-binding XRE family transcriptional regulator
MTDSEFRAHREAIPMTTIELAAWLGVSRMSVWRWEKGRAAIPAEIARAVWDAATDPTLREIAATDAEMRQMAAERGGE